MQNLNKKIKIALGNEKADIVFKNCKIANVFTSEFYMADIAVEEGVIVAIGEYEGINNIDIGGKIVCPTLFDGHVHIESSMVSPAEFTKILLKSGVSSIIADPHEIANVKGEVGLDYMLNATEDLPVNVYFMLPSCVPVTKLETSGGVLDAEDLEEYKTHKRVVGLGEMMDYEGVIERDEEVIKKLEAFQDMVIDGHGPMLTGNKLNAYFVSKIHTEHECSTVEEMNERLRLGMYIQLREASGAKNLRTLLKGVNSHTIDRCFFCTDDRHPESLLTEGSIDNNIRIAMEEGIDPIDAIKMGAFNGPVAYGIKNIGAIAPNYLANFIVLDDLDTFKIRDVYIKGEKVVDNGEVIYEAHPYPIESVGDSVNLPLIEKKDLFLDPVKMDGDLYIIKAIPDSLITDAEKIESVTYTEDPIYDNALKKLVVINRHTGEKNIAVSAINGFGDFNGALGTTIAHDSHNLIIIGSNDDDIMSVIDEIKKIGGGIVLVNGGKILDSLPLEIAGIMSSDTIENVDKKLREILDNCKDLGFDKEIDPIMTLSFMALPVIPSLKLTDRGLFDVDKFSYIWRN